MEQSRPLIPAIAIAVARSIGEVFAFRIFVAWLLVTALGTFVIGGLVLFSPIPILSDWLKSVYLYDIATTIGYGYAVLMSLTAIAIGLYQEPDSFGRRVPYKASGQLVLAGLGGIILFGLLMGQLIRIVS